MRMALVTLDESAEAARFASAFAASPSIEALPMSRWEDAARALTAGTVRGIVMIQNDFSARLQRGDASGVQVITDGSDPNTASFAAAYVQGAWAHWQDVRRTELGWPAPAALGIEPRYWYNPAAISRNFLVPGSIVIIMTVVGALLTSLVVAREWERGTMEALLSTPVTRTEFLLSKLIPYYLLGMASMAVCTTVAVTILGTPLRGSLWMLYDPSPVCSWQAPWAAVCCCPRHCATSSTPRRPRSTSPSCRPSCSRASSLRSAACRRRCAP
jgi:ABC-2 type transport system permease protein